MKASQLPCKLASCNPMSAPAVHIQSFRTVSSVCIYWVISPEMVFRIRSGFHADQDPDPGSQTNADPDPDPGKTLQSQKDEYTRKI